MLIALGILFGLVVALVVWAIVREPKTVVVPPSDAEVERYWK